MALPSGSLTGNATVDKAIRGAAGNDIAALQYLVVTGSIESNYKPDAYNPSGAKGLYQFMPKTAEQYDLTDPYDPVASAKAALRLRKDNADYLEQQLGRKPSNAELYLAHQQGMGGAIKLLKNPSASAASLVGMGAVEENGGTAGMTAGEFANTWLNKYNGVFAASSVAGVALPSTTSVSTVVADLKTQGDGKLSDTLKLIEAAYKAQNGQMSEDDKKAMAKGLDALKKDTNDVFAQYGVTKTDVTEMLALHVGSNTAAAISAAGNDEKLSSIAITKNGRTIRVLKESVNGFIGEMKQAGVQIPADKNYDNMTAGDLEGYTNSFYSIQNSQAASMATRATQGKMTKEETKSSDFMSQIMESMSPEMGGFLSFIMMIMNIFTAPPSTTSQTKAAPQSTDQPAIPDAAKEAANAVTNSSIQQTPASVPTAPPAPKPVTPTKQLAPSRQ